MRIDFSLNNSEYDCRLVVNDSRGSREFFIFAPNKSMNVNSTYIGLEVYSSDFEITVVPITPKMEISSEEGEKRSLFDRVLTKTAESLASEILKIILRVSSRYRVTNAQDNDRIDLNYRTYVHGGKSAFSSELIPMMYVFFEAEDKNGRLKPEEAYGINRREVIKFARNWSLFEGVDLGAFGLFLTYPFQLGRIRYLSKRKRVFKKLKKLYLMNDEQRQSFFEKQEEFFVNL